MQGLILDVPLSLGALLRRTETLFGHKRVVTRKPDRTIARRTYAACLRRARRLGAGRRSLGFAAVAAAWALGIEPALIRAGIGNFHAFSKA